jgi:hypothetical protein
MRSEEEVRSLYRNYVYRHAIALLNGQRDKASEYFGASVATGRTLGRDMKRINKDFYTAKTFIKRLREEGKQLPGFKEA